VPQISTDTTRFQEVPKVKNPKRTIKLNPSFKNNLTRLLQALSKMLKPFNLEPHLRTLMLSKPSPMQLLTKIATVLLKNHLIAPRLMKLLLRPIPLLMLPPMQLLTKPSQMLTLMHRLPQRVLEPQLPWHKITPRLKKKKQ